MRHGGLIARTVLAIGAACLCATAAGATSSIGIGSVDASAPVTNGAMAWIAATQTAFFGRLRDALTAMNAGEGTVWFLVGLSFVYGVFHAAGPGHGKAVIASYVCADRVQLRRGIALAVAASQVQAATAIALVILGWFALRGTGWTVTAMGDALRIAAYAGVAVFGAYIVVRALAGPARAGMRRVAGMRRERSPALAPASGSVSPVAGLAFAAPERSPQPVGARPGRFVAEGFSADVCQAPGEACGCGRPHMPDPATLGDAMTWRTAAIAILAIGLRPCAGAVVVMTFSVVNGLVAAGVASVFAMAVGTALTVSAIAALAVAGRGLTVRLAGHGRWIAKGFEIAGGAVMLLIGLSLLSTAA